VDSVIPLRLRFWHQQPFYGFSSLNMAFDNFLRIVQVLNTVPHSIGINHNARPILTRVQTACCVSTDPSFQTQSSNFLFKVLSNSFGASCATTPLGVTLGTLIYTNENVVFVSWHFRVAHIGLILALFRLESGSVGHFDPRLRTPPRLL